MWGWLRSRQRVNVLTSIAETGLSAFHGDSSHVAGAVFAGTAFSVVGVIVYFAVYSVTHAATVSAVSSIYLGEPTSMGKALDAVKGHWLRYCLIAMWQSWSAGWIFGVIFLPVFLVPCFGEGKSRVMVLVGSLVFLLSFGGVAYGVIAYIRNSLAIPAAVMENLAFDER